ncbi:MAG: excisionase family DNA-binding protein [Parvibaculum sp.]|nr:excisionase family DNA-binding protein [Parvibaculum sp.]
MEARPFTPETLAARWGCTSKTIRRMIRRGEIRSFTVGARLVRIPADEVERVEACQISGSENIAENSSSSGPMPKETEGAIRSARLTGQKLTGSSPEPSPKSSVVPIHAPKR